MDPATLIALITAVLGSGLLTAVANNVWQRRRNRADTAAVLNATALDLVVPLREQIKELRGEVASYRHRLGVLERREREMMTALAQQNNWAVTVQALLLSNKIEFPPMPPLAQPSSVDMRTRAEDYRLPDTYIDVYDDEPPLDDGRRRRRGERDHHRRPPVDRSDDRSTSTETNS